MYIRLRISIHLCISPVRNVLLAFRLRMDLTMPSWASLWNWGVWDASPLPGKLAYVYRPAWLNIKPMETSEMWSISTTHGGMTEAFKLAYKLRRRLLKLAMSSLLSSSLCSRSCLLVFKSSPCKNRIFSSQLATPKVTWSFANLIRMCQS